MDKQKFKSIGRLVAEILCQRGWEMLFWEKFKVSTMIYK